MNSVDYSIKNWHLSAPYVLRNCWETKQMGGYRVVDDEEAAPEKEDGDSLSCSLDHAHHRRSKRWTRDLTHSLKNWMASYVKEGCYIITITTHRIEMLLLLLWYLPINSSFIPIENLRCVSFLKVFSLGVRIVLVFVVVNISWNSKLNEIFLEACSLHKTRWI